MPSRQQRVNASRYRQVRLTLTQEISGRVSYSIYAKGLNEAWNEHQVLVRDSLQHDPILLSSEDVYACLIAVLREQLLPGID